jgi:hypothetical protein
MVAKARRLLAAPSAADPLGRLGLLLIHDTLALDPKAKTWQEQTNLVAWSDAIESLGFTRLRHQKLKRSHALAFVTRPLDTCEAERLLDESSLPELLLRREVTQRSGEGSGLPYLRARADREALDVV